MRIFTSVVAGATLVAGFGVAQASDNRSLGGAVLLAGAAVCGIQWWREAGPRAALLSEGVLVLAFAGSHVLAKPLGAWPSVGLVALATAALSYALTAPRNASNSSLEPA
ncbi:MAG TPA: hypothetical protein DDY88_06555 [Actinobacteria bacterium]|nr:hypothetical protein [Actinomycetota bacterium]